MRFSDIGIALMTLVVSVYSQDTEQPVTNLNDVRPGHIEDMAALPYEIVSVLFLATFNFTIANTSHSNAASDSTSPWPGTFTPNTLTSSAIKAPGNGTKTSPSASPMLFPHLPPTPSPSTTTFPLLCVAATQAQGYR